MFLKYLQKDLEGPMSGQLAQGGQAFLDILFYFFIKEL